VPEERRLDQMLISIEGNRLSPELYELLSLVRVEESVHLPDAFSLRFDDPHFELLDSMRFTMGSKVEVAFSAEGDPVIVARGEVTAIAVEQGPSGRHELVVSGMDQSHRLTHGPKSRTFQNMTDADIVSQIAEGYGFDTYIDATAEVHEYVIQSSQSDYGFLKQRGDRIGFDLWVADEKLYFKKQPTSNVRPPLLTWGENLHKFKVRFSAAERCDEVTVRGWDPPGKATVMGRAAEGDLGTTAPAAASFDDDARSAFGEVTRFAGQFPVRTAGEADALARSLILKASGEQVVARGEASGDPMIAAGAEVDVRSVGQQLSGTYRITSSEHIYGAGTPYVTRFVCGGKDPAGFADLVANGSGQASGMQTGWGSLVIGLVTNNDDPDKLGRVKVKFPSLTDNDESAWAKVLTPGGGDTRGMQCTPEVQDEVLVGFEHDDKRRPVVLGGLWSMTDRPPREVVDGGQVVRRSWMSRSGHLIELVDDASEAAISLVLSGGKSSLTIEKETALTGESSITIRSKKVVVKADTDLSLEAKNIDIKGTAQVSIKGSPVRIN
jgi:uncharacterized protein involved in type VI secretion and phage assembly